MESTAGSEFERGETGGRGGAGHLLAVLAAAGLARLALLWWFSGVGIHIWDERDYHTLATHLAEYGEFSFVFGQPVSIRPPLYPLFLSAVYDLFGVGSFQAARAQGVLGLATAALAYALGSRLYDRRTGLWAAAFCAFYPSLLIVNDLILTETLFTFFLTATVLAVVAGFRSGTAWQFAGAGVLLGLGALTRSVLWLFIPVLPVYVLAARPGPLPARLKASAALFLAAAATVAPWAVRNTMLEKTFLTVDSMGGRNVMMGNYEHTPLHRSWDTISIAGPESWDAVLTRETPESSGATQGQKDKMAMRYGIKYALSHPSLTARRDLVKFFDFWGLEREQVAAALQGWLGPVPRLGVWAFAAAVVLSYVAAFFLGIFGALAAPPSSRRDLGLCVLVVAFVTGMHTLSFGHSRYHLPLMPLVLVLAAAAACRLGRVWDARRGWAFRIAVCLCVTFVLAWGYDALLVDRALISGLFAR